MNFLKFIIKKIKLFRITFFKTINKEFYSQFGEDKILNEIILKNFTKGFYVDVGCFHPKKHSNTYLLYIKGWNGINIDMEVDKINSFKLARPSDFNILSAVSDKNIKTKFYTTQEYGVGSTLEKDFIIKENNVLQEKIISTKTLNEIIENSPYKNKEIDLLNIDVEGHDFKVLFSLDFSIYNPKIIIIESHIKNIDLILKSEIYLFLTKKNYSLRSWNLYSLIFVNNTSLITIDFKD